jgi:hypothetical protein
MSKGILSENLFIAYASKLQCELELLKRFTMPDFETWEIDWDVAYEISQVPGKKKPWSRIELCKELIARKSLPAIYYFSCDEDSAAAIHTAFVEHKKEKKNNVSFVPDNFKGGNCIYVGSRKDGVNGRLVQHLGFKEKGGTGALYLNHVLQKLSIVPKITFHCAILHRRYRNVTKHIEAVVQDDLKPFIGKRAIERLEIGESL